MSIYAVCFGLLLCVVMAIRRADISALLSASSASMSDAKRKEFVAFHKNYLLVYALVFMSDWFQGPFVYVLYRHYNYSHETIATLFVVGFASSFLAGFVVGPFADRVGRRLASLAFCVLYAIGCCLKHSPSLVALTLGRVAAGISTSLLYSVFDAWMVAEHTRRGFSSEWLGETFTSATTLNGVVAIVSGFVADALAQRFGYVAPFDAAALLLAVAFVVITMTWSENKAEKENPNDESMLSLAKEAANVCFNDLNVALLGVIQSTFEGGMFIFVFQWSNALALTAPDQYLDEAFPYGMVFGAFMACVMLGSSLSMETPQLSLLSLSLLSALAFCVPAVTTHHWMRLLAFFVFEACVGMFWPSIGQLKSSIVPERCRATLYNVFRAGLNIIVITVLLNVDALPERTIFVLCAICMAVSATCAYVLQNRLAQSQDKGAVGTPKSKEYVHLLQEEADDLDEQLQMSELVDDSRGNSLA
ncbi:MAG: hypothetical protein MHM6MM_002696 [Cercozoa sp. M6MM]